MKSNCERLLLKFNNSAFWWWIIVSTCYEKRISCVFAPAQLSHKKRKYNPEGILDRVLFAPKLEFPKILVPRLPKNSLNVNTECARKWKQLYSIYSLCDQLLGAIIYLHFIILILMFLIYYACCKQCNIWLLLFENNSRSYYCTRASHWRKNIVVVITYRRWWYMTIWKGKLKNELCILVDCSY